MFPGRLVAVLVAVALGCGLLTAGVTHRGPDRAPFLGALVALSTAPEVHYRTASLDAHVTQHGELTGSITRAGQEYALLRVDDRLYVKPPGSALRAMLPPTRAADLADRWLTGRIADGLAGPLAAQLVPPPVLADHLARALRTARLPAQGARTAVVDGVAVLTASTPIGELRVSRDAPYRVVRLDPPSTGAPSDTPRTPRTPSTPGVPGAPDDLAAPRTAAAEPASAVRPASAPALRPASAPARWAQAHPVHPIGDGGGHGAVAYLPQEPGDVGATYDRLLDSVAQLSSADDTDVSFDLHGDPDVHCSPVGCLVTETVTTDAGRGTAAALRGSVTVRLSAEVTLNGTPAGSCSASTTVPLNGSATLGCTDAEAGPRYRSLRAALSADAQARADATGRTAYYRVEALAEVSVHAVASIDTGRLSRTLRSEAAAAPQDECQSFPGGTRVLMADGTARPIEEIRTGDLVAARAPGSTRLLGRPVTDRRSTADEHAFVRIVLTGDDRQTPPGRSGTAGTASVIATAGHYFATAVGWTRADRLAAGDRLQTSAGGTASVAAVHPFTADRQVHDLTVAGAHDFFVLAGGRPVLVHNVGCRLFPQLARGAKTFEIPKVKGIYFIELNDGTMYIGMSEDSIYRRVTKAFSSRRSAVRAAGYNHADAVSILWSDMTGFSTDDIFKAEDDWMKLAESMGITLHNRISSPGASLNKR
ncbi:polymorphic toxin-type HINT domain-containing protein [Streptomyces sp. MS06]|uniref:Hint domain-containing protein n=1 Tax=Streptomyces sp. MS06 TaxID=3385974 RepID=UPI0039A1F0B9